MHHIRLETGRRDELIDITGELRGLIASATIVVEKGQLVLGQWQHLFFCEFDGPRTRTVLVKLMAGH